MGNTKLKGRKQDKLWEYKIKMLNTKKKSIFLKTSSMTQRHPLKLISPTEIITNTQLECLIKIIFCEATGKTNKV